MGGVSHDSATLGAPKRKRESEVDSHRPAPRKRTKRPSPPLDDDDGNPPPTKSTSESKFSNTHTKKERQSNRSSRIHSLRRELSRGHLPQVLQREKERELSSLLLDQQKNKIREKAKQNLERYHFVRFVEKQKAQKRLKQLRKEQERLSKSGGPEDADRNATVKAQIHEMEVNRNYAIYAPLGEKYISVFAADVSRKPKRQRRGETDRLESDPPGDVQEKNEESTDPAPEADDHDNTEGTGAQKPPMWYEIEAAMTVGMEKLEALRDRKTNVAMVDDTGASNGSAAGSGPKTISDKNKKQKQQEKATPGQEGSKRVSRPSNDRGTPARVDDGMDVDAAEADSDGDDDFFE